MDREPVDELVDLLHDREEAVDRVIEDRVQRPFHAPREELRRPAQLLRHAIDRRHRTGVHGDQVMRPEKAVQLLRLQVVRIVGVGRERHAADDDEQESVVFLELDARIRIERVLDRERMEPKDLCQQRMLRAHRRVDIDPHRAAIGQQLGDVARVTIEDRLTRQRSIDRTRWRIVQRVDGEESGGDGSHDQRIMVARGLSGQRL